MTADELIGTWVIDNLSEFGGYSSAVIIELLSGGTGAQSNDKAPVSVTWQVDENQLLISNSAESINYDIAIWLVKNVRYQFAASPKLKQMIAHDSCSFNGER